MRKDEKGYSDTRQNTAGEKREMNRPICEQCETKKNGWLQALLWVGSGSSFDAHLLGISKQVQEKRHFTGELKQLSVDKVESHKCSYCRKQGLKLEFKVCSDCG